MYLTLLITKKYKTKINFPFTSKESYFVFKVMELSLYFSLNRELDSSFFSILAMKLFHVAGPRMDLRNLHLRSLDFGLLYFTLEKHVGYESKSFFKGCMKS